MCYEVILFFLQSCQRLELKISGKGPSANCTCPDVASLLSRVVSPLLFHTSCRPHAHGYLNCHSVNSSSIATHTHEYVLPPTFLLLPLTLITG
jgi:hypothetical protein